MKRMRLFALAAGLIIGCDGPVDPEFDYIDNALFAISDGTHTSGNSGFFFLPPLVPQPSFDGEFDAELSVTVEICEFTDPVCDPIIESFSDVTVVDEHYQVNWHTKQSGPVSDMVYRISVRVGPRELGFADVVARPCQARRCP